MHIYIYIFTFPVLIYFRLVWGCAGDGRRYVRAVDMDGIRAALQRMDCAVGSRSVLHRHLRANPVRRHRDDSLVPGLLQCIDGAQSRTVAGEYPVMLIFIYIFLTHQETMRAESSYIFLWIITTSVPKVRGVLYAFI